jgi:hypothetical protein
MGGAVAVVHGVRSTHPASTGVGCVWQGRVQLARTRGFVQFGPAINFCLLDRRSTQCERAAEWLCDLLVVSHSPDCRLLSLGHLALGSAVLGRATRLRTGMGSNQAARSARYLLSACALVVSHATAFLSQITLDSFLSRGLSTTKRGASHAVLIYLQNLPPPPRFFSEPTADTEHIANTDTEHVRF